MNVYRVEYFYGGNVDKPINHFVAAETMEQVLGAHNPDDEAIALIELLGGIIFASEATPAREGGRKLTGVEIKGSITVDHLISFEDGKPYKSLKRHLTVRGLTPDQYRTKWGLPPEYPMVSLRYSENRSQLAKSAGLGRRK